MERDWLKKKIKKIIKLLTNKSAVTCVKLDHDFGVVFFLTQTGLYM